MRPCFVWVVMATLFAIAAPARAMHPIKVLAAENFYGDVAKQIGGRNVAVTNILSSPDQDPHLFEVSPSVARAVAGAQIVIYNGVGYDPWMTNLLRAVHGTDRKTIVVANLVGTKAGANPHIWYDPATMLAAAKALARDLSGIDPAHGADYSRRLTQFERSMRPLEAKIEALRRRSQGRSATATEPVFGYMFEALRMQVEDKSFQLAVMNDTEPSASDMASLENELKAHRVDLLVYNSQALDPVAERMVKLAKTSHVPVVAATETEPPGKTYQAWMLSELDAVEQALKS